MASRPTPAALSQPMLALFLFSFLLNAMSGIGLWLYKIQFWRALHGWSIPFFLIVFGIIWRVHILRGWNLKKNVISGVVTLLVFLGLTITGWMIYYSGSDQTQKISASFHTWLGLGVSFILFIHGILGWKTREKA
jgi:hypothetical protein